MFGGYSLRYHPLDNPASGADSSVGHVLSAQVVFIAGSLHIGTPVVDQSLRDQFDDACKTYPNRARMPLLHL